MKRFIAPALLLAVLMLHACGSNKKLTTTQTGLHTSHVSNLQPGHAGKGLYYSLPRTAVSVNAEVMQTVNTPGPFAEYAERFLGISDAITSRSVSFEILNVTVESYNEPDPAQVYFIHLPDDHSQDIFVSLNETGIITGVNKKFPETERTPYTPESKDFERFSDEAGFTHYVDFNLMEQVDTIIEHIREDTATVERQTLRRVWVEKTIEQRAREAADHILEIREKKFDLISGFQEITYSKEALEYMYKEMTRMENNYLDLFTGISSTNKVRYRYTHKPLRDQADKSITLFRFSEKEGVLPANEEKGAPVVLSYLRNKNTDPLREQLSRQGTDTGPFMGGIHYRIPEQSDVYIKLDGEARSHARLLINQFGVVARLPATDMKINFCPETGAVLSIGIDERKIIEE